MRREKGKRKKFFSGNKKGERDAPPRSRLAVQCWKKVQTFPLDRIQSGLGSLRRLGVGIRGSRVGGGLERDRNPIRRDTLFWGGRA